MNPSPPTNPTTTDPEEHLRSVARSGWSRMKPPSMALLLLAVAAFAEFEEGLPRAALFPAVGAVGPNTSCWDRLDPEYGYGEEELRAEQEQADTIAAHYNLGPVRTMNDTVNLLVACGALLENTGPNGDPHLRLPNPVPTPLDLFPLPEEEAKIHRFLLRSMQYEHIEHGIIELFEPMGTQHPTINTTLNSLASHLQATIEDVRGGLELLLETDQRETNNEFTSITDPSAADPDDPIRLHCDWDLFAENRVVLTSAPEADD